MVKEIPLTQGYLTLVDDEDFDSFSAFKWHALTPRKNGIVYAVRNKNPQVKGHRAMIYLHREIIGAPCGLYVDHINGDGLDNRRGNLRLASRSQNAANSKLPSVNTSGFRGVYRTPSGWRARIVIQQQDFNLGHFADSIDAALAYDAAARRLQGEFARLNFPEKGVVSC